MFAFETMRQIVNYIILTTIIIMESNNQELFTHFIYLQTKYL